MNRTQKTSKHGEYMKDSYIKGLSIVDISKETGISRSTVRRFLLKEGVLRDRVSGIRLSASKGKFGHWRVGKKYPYSEESKERARVAAKKRWSGNARGYRINTNGYKEITVGEHIGKLQHRIIYESFHNINIPDGFVVHHKNGIKTDNRIENLELMEWSKHSSFHAKNIEKSRNKKGQFKSKNK